MTWCYVRLTKIIFNHYINRISSDSFFLFPHIINAIHFSSVNELRPIVMPLFFFLFLFSRISFACLNANNSPINRVFLNVLHRKYYSSKFPLDVVCWRNNKKKETLSKFDVGNDWFHSGDCCEMCCMDRERKRERKMMKMPSSRHTVPHFFVFARFFFWSFFIFPSFTPPNKMLKHILTRISYSLTFLLWPVQFESNSPTKCLLVSQTTMTHSSFHSMVFDGPTNAKLTV